MIDNDACFVPQGEISFEFISDFVLKLFGLFCLEEILLLLRQTLSLTDSCHIAT